MKEESLFPLDTQVFLLRLQSPLKSKRILEAIEQLRIIYPFKINIENIYIEKTDAKGMFNVFVSKDKIEVKKSNFKKIIMIVIFFSIIFLFVCLGKMYISKVNEKKQVKVEIEKQHAEKEKIQKENEAKLHIVKEKYELLVNSEYDIIYPIIEHIYYCLGEKTTVETISIEKNSFSIDLTTKDTITILKNFEKSSFFSSVKMNRTTTVDEKEIVNFTGKYVNYIESPKDILSTIEKIYFYQEKIRIIEEKKKAQTEIALSDYIRQIREELKKNHCVEQYIQLRGEKKNIEIECFVYSTSKNILNFLKQIQEIGIPFYEIKAVKIRNNQYQEKIQTTVIFASGIELKEQELLVTENQKQSMVSSSELSSIFYKKTQQPTPVLKPTEVVSVSTLDKRTALKKIAYIGMTRINGAVVVIVKDEEMNVLYKLPCVQNELDTDCYIEKNGESIAKIQNEYYRVEK